MREYTGTVADPAYDFDTVIEASLSVEGQTDGFTFTPTGAGATHLDGRLVFSVGGAFDPRAGWKVTVLDGSLQELASVDSSTLAGFASDGEISIDLALEADQPVIVRVSDSDDQGAVHSDADYAVALMTRPQSSDDQGYGVLTSGVDFHGSFSSLSPETLVLELAAGEAGDQSTFSLGAGSPGVTLRIYDQSGSVLTEAGTNAQIDGYSLSAGESIDFNTSSAAQTVLVELTPSSTGAYVANLNGAGDRMVYSPGLLVLDNVSMAAGLYQTVDVDLTLGSVVSLADIFGVVGDAQSLYLYSEGTDSALTLSQGASSVPLSTDVANPTEISVADLGSYLLDLGDNSAVNADGGGSVNSVAASRFVLNGFARSASSVSDPQDPAATASTSKTMAARIDVIEEGVMASLDSSRVEEGENVTLTLTLVGSTSTSYTLSNPSGDLLFDGLETTTVDLVAGSPTTVTVAAVSEDLDFSASESVEIFLTPVNVLPELIVPPVTLSVTETVPQFQLSVTEGRALIASDDLYQARLELVNADEFNDDAISVTLAVADGFELGGLSSSLSDADLTVTLGGASASSAIFVGKDSGSYASLDGVMGFDVSVSGSAAPSSIPDLVVTRVASASASSTTTELPGTSGDDVMYAGASIETVTGLAGDDCLVFGDTSQLNGSSFDGGSDTDTVFLPGPRSDYGYSEEGATTTLFVSGDVSQSVALTNVEHVRFNYAATPTTYEVTVASRRYLIDGTAQDEFDLVQGNTYRFDLSDPSIEGHPFAFRTSDGTPYTDGVGSTGTLGNDMVVTFVVPEDAPSDLQYYCTVHTSTMGADINVINPQVSIGDLNTSPVESDTHGVTDDDFALNEGSTITVNYGAIFTDPEGDTLRYRLRYDGSEVLPSWIVVDQDATTVTLSPGIGNATMGTDLVIEVTDKSAWVQDSSPSSVSYRVVVSDVNNPPSAVSTIPNTAMLVSGARGSSDVVIDFDEYYADADGDGLTYGLEMTDGSSLPGWVLFPAGSSAVTFDSSGLTETATYRFVLTVTDDSGETNAETTDEFVVSVVDRLSVGLQRASVGSELGLDITDLENLYGLAQGDLAVSWTISSDYSSWGADSGLSGFAPTPVAGHLGQYVRASVAYTVDGVTYTTETAAQSIKPAATNILIGRVPGYDEVVIASDSAAFEATVLSGEDTVSTTPVSGEVASFLVDQAVADGFSLDLTSDTVQTSVNISDAVGVLKHIVGLSTFDSQQHFIADMNNDGSVNISDAVSILKVIVGLEESPTLFGYVEDEAGNFSRLIDAEAGHAEFYLGVMGDIDGSTFSTLLADML